MLSKKEFAQFLIDVGALKFGDFILKSGRKSPYFFNFGIFDDGKKLAQLGEFYAKAILEYKIQADLLFGPAYKGIPLVCTTAVALAQQGKVFPFAFNRKEAKDHGEGGVIVGADLRGQRVLILDDVLTAGTSARQSITLIRQHGGIPVGLLVALDREEPTMEGKRAAEALLKEGIAVYSILRVSELIPLLDKDWSERIENYLQSLTR